MLNRGEIESRIDPLYYSLELFKFLETQPYKVTTLRNVTEYLLTGFAAGKGEQSYGDEVVQIRPTNIANDRELTFERNVYLAYELVAERPLDVLKKNEVLFNNTNSQELVGKSALFNLDGKFFCSNHMTRIGTDRSQILPEYLTFVLNWYQERKVFYTICTNWNNQSGVNVKLLQKIKIPCPTIVEQQKITSFLRKNKEKRNEKYRKADEALASIDGVVLDALGIELPEKDDGSLENRVFYSNSAAITGRRIDPEARHRERVSAIEAVTNGKFPVERLRDAAAFIKKQVSENPLALPYVGLENIDGNTGFYSPNAEIEDFGSANLFEAGQVLFPKLRPYLNKVFLSNFDGVCSTEFHVLNGKSVSSAFLAAFLRNEIVVRQTKRLMTGNTLPRLQTDDIESLLIPLPPPTVQAKIVEKVDAIYAEAKRLRREGDEILAKAKEEVERMLLDEA